jgi:hypothetical protein
MRGCVPTSKFHTPTPDPLSVYEGLGGPASIVRYRGCFAVDGGVLASGVTFSWNTRLTLTILNTIVYEGLVVVS